MGPLIFADTSFWIASSYLRDRYEHSALAWQDYIKAHQIQLITTEPVIWEWLNAMAATQWRNRAFEHSERCRRDNAVRIIAVNDQSRDEALKLYSDRADKRWSITDCFSFIVMSNLAISDALTADRHFIQAGFSALLLQSPPSA